MTVYFLSGLGADSRAFKYLTFPANTKIVFIDWLPPYKKEPLTNYAKRIAACIDTSGPFILAGMSFGGILATEVIQFIQPEKTILLSSVTCRQQLPFCYRLAGRLKLDKLLPAKATNMSNWFTYRMFGISNKKDKLLLDEILKNTDTAFSKWAIHEILNWKRKISPAGIIRIHGTGDRILPVNNFKPTYLLKNAGHFMIVNRAKEISVILEKEINHCN